MQRRIILGSWLGRMGLVIAAAVLPAGLLGCESYDNGSTRTKTTRTVETPEESVTTTTTKEKKVEDYPR